MDRQQRKTLVAVNSYGLGHATRCIPIIEAMLDNGDKVFVLSCGRPLLFLREYFGERVQCFFEVKDYSFHLAFSKKGFSPLKFFFLSPLFVLQGKWAHRKFAVLDKKHGFDLIISDTRYEIYNKRKPSFLLVHHILGVVPWCKTFSRLLSEFYAFSCIHNKFTKMLIPDYRENSLAGELDHGFVFLKEHVHYEYIGTLSMLKKEDIEEDIDYFFSISGPEPQRSVFECAVMELIKKIPEKKIVVSRGVPEQQSMVKLGKTTIYGCLSRTKQNEVMNRAKLVVTRPGSSTLMDLVEIGKRAVVIPTPGQPEQEYLAEYLSQNGSFLKISLEDLSSLDFLKKSGDYTGFRAHFPTAQAIENIISIIDNG